MSEMNGLLKQYEQKLVEIFKKEIGDDNHFYTPYTDGFEIKCVVEVKYKFGKQIPIIYHESKHVRAKEVGFDRFHKWIEHTKKAYIGVPDEMRHSHGTIKRPDRQMEIRSGLPNEYIHIICSYGDTILKNIPKEIQSLKKEKKEEEIKYNEKREEQKKRLDVCKNKLKKILGE